MTALRRRMLEDMQVRNLSAGTQQVYLQHISRFARYCGRSPAELGPEEIRAYQLYLTKEKQLTPSTLVIAALRSCLICPLLTSASRSGHLLYRVTLQKTWSIEAVIPAPKKPQRLPVVLSPAEVVRLLDSVNAGTESLRGDAAGVPAAYLPSSWSRPSASSLSGHAAEDVVDRGRHPRAEETAEVTRRAQPGRGGAVARQRKEPQASHHPDDLLCRGPSHLGSRALDRAGD